MTLSTERPFNKTNYAPGVYINEVNIVEAEDISGATLPYLDHPADIGIKLTLDIGRDFQPEFVIAGNFKRDDLTSDVTGWGSAWFVQDALFRLGYVGSLENGNKIPADVISSLVGKSFYRLAYVSGVKDNGKFRYSDWNQIASLEEGADNLASRFRKSVAKGYPRNYHSDLLELQPVVSDTSILDEEVF